MRPMTKTEALSHFGDDTVPIAAKVAACAEFLGISKQAIYMWPEEEIPELRALQIVHGKVPPAATPVQAQQ